MAKTKMTFVRITPEIREMMDTLARAWGPVVELGDSDVIRESIRLAHEHQFATARKSRKNLRQEADGA
jgi:Arc/MetJ-type ribon-helix-helix transcriptional regulator